MFETINRDAVILAPKKSFVDWINRIYPNEKISYSDPLEHDKASIYLLPERENPEASLKYLKANFKPILKEELMACTTDEDSWPMELTWELFNEWFHISIQSMIVDTIDDKISKDDF